MKGLLNIHVEFLDARAAENIQMPVEYAPGQEQTACMKMLASINATGGILFFEPNGLTLLPMSSLKSINITAPSVVSADLGDLNSLNRGGVTL